MAHDPAVIRDALASALANLPNEQKQRLCLCGLVQIPANDYLSIPNPAS